MRIDVCKKLFIGPIKHRASFFHAIQELGVVHFISNGNHNDSFLNELISLYTQAVKILEHYDSPEESIGQVSHPYDFCHAVINLQKKKETLEIHIKQLELRLAELAPLGSIPYQELASLQSYTSIVPRLWIAPTSKQAGDHSSKLILLSKAGEKEYFISLSPQAPHFSGLREIILDEQTKKIGQEYASAKQQQKEIDDELKRRASWLIDLRAAFVDTMNATRREIYEAQTQTPLDNRLFAIQGWIPETKKEQVHELCKKHDVLMEPISQDPKEMKPTYLENKGFSKIGEDLVSIYDTPSYKDYDPSLWVLGFFSLFFAFIVNDSGYGLVFLITALYIYFKNRPKAEFGKRILKLVGLLGISCIAWGCFTQSFFGMEIDKDNPLHTLSVIDPLINLHAKYHIDQADLEWKAWTKLHNDVTNPTIEQYLASTTESGKLYGQIFKDHLFFEIALLIGVLHIIVGMARYIPKRPAYLGWILFLLGAYMYIPNYLEATSILQPLFDLNAETFTTIGKDLIIVGFFIAVFCTLLSHGISALLESVMTPVQLFSDVLSYLRLYALSMAGAIVAELINSLGNVLPQPIAWLLIPLCHGVNLFIGVVGGVIHGLRLNFLEWYHYSFEGGGKQFTPLALEKNE